MSRKPLEKWAQQQLVEKTKKVEKYSNLSDNYHFVPVGIETYGTYGPQGIDIKLVKQIGKKKSSGRYW